MGAVTRRPLVVLGVTAVLALAGAALALRLDTSAATSTLVNRGSDTYKDTERFKRDFGGEAILVLVRGDVQKTVLTSDLGRLIRLEGCLSGNVPDNKQGLGSLPPVCRQIAELHPAKVVYGPGTFINTAVNQINAELMRRGEAATAQARQAASVARRLSKRRGDPPAEQRRLAESAARAVQAKFISDTLKQALRYGITGQPRINDPSFVSTLVFDTSTGESGLPKSRFAYLFPSKNAALIQMRLRPDLSDADQQRAIELIRTATGEKVFKPRKGAKYIVTGVPVVAAGLADAVKTSIFVLLGAALLLMAATLALVCGARVRLLPLALALAAAAMTFGAPRARRGRPDDGVDRRAARADRAGGGLRDPVPGALRGGGLAQRQRGRRERGRSRGPRCGGRRRRRPHDPHRRARHRDRLPRAAALAGADGARLRSPARRRDRGRTRLRAVRRLRRAGPLRRAWRRRGARPATRGGRRPPALAPAAPARARGGRMARRPLLAHARLRALAPAARARRSASPWRWSGWRSTRRARSSRTSASWCRRTSRR